MRDPRFLFDEAAEIAVRSGATIFDFRHKIGSCLIFDPKHPEEGIACEESWFLKAIERAGFRVGLIQRGNWRTVRSYATAKTT